MYAITTGRIQLVQTMSVIDGDSEGAAVADV